MSTVTVHHLIQEPLGQQFEELFREHYQLVYRTAYGVTGRAEDAEDVLQTVFLKLMRRRTAPDFQKNPKGYLYRAAVTVSLDILQARRRHASAEDVEGLEIPQATTHSDPYEADRKRLSNALAQLRPRAVEILILRYQHDYSDAEIAKMLGTSRGVIAVSLYRSRARLRRLLHTLKEGKQ
jgi:RNA polymerase sigma-70 factor, ECF subfamily